jgi:hypothetical protein
MLRKALSLLVLLLGVGMSATAAAAPLWIERKFIPKPELIDPRFDVASDTQNTLLDHGLWDAFLTTYVSQGADGIHRVRYSDVTPESRQQLEDYISALEAINTAQLTRDQQLAYWINLYNAATVRLILEQYPISSIRKVTVSGKGPWDHAVVTVQDTALSLGDIEHHIVRAIFPDPRIHYALNCASIGCPNLAMRAYTAETLEQMLDDAAKAYVNHPRGVSLRKNKADISKIYGWYREDFGDGEADVLAHIKRYAQGDLSESLKAIKKVGRYGYDWALNEVPPEPAQ